MKKRRAWVSVMTVMAVALAACGGDPEIYEVSPEQAAAEFKLSDPIAAVPAFEVEVKAAFTDDQIESLRELPGVAAVAAASIRWMRIDTDKKSDVNLRIAGVDPLEFRPIAPSGTRDADFVWLSLLTGSAVLTHDAAGRLGIGGRKGLSGVGALNVGALADHGQPNFADAIVDAEHFKPGSWDAPTVAVVGAETGVTIEALRKDVQSLVPEATLTRVRPPNVSQPALPQPYVAPAGSPGTVAGLHPTLAESVQRVLGAARGRVWVVSGYRTTARQYQLWIGALQKYGDPDIADNWVAPPGHSFHERGLAVDLGGDVEYAAQLVAQMQLPMWRPMSWEPWHFELVGSRG